MDNVRKAHIMSFSLDSAAKTSEIIGAIAVIVGLLFVGAQVRDNTVAQQFSATQTLVSEYNAAISSAAGQQFHSLYAHDPAGTKAVSSPHHQPAEKAHCPPPVSR